MTVETLTVTEADAVAAREALTAAGIEFVALTVCVRRGYLAMFDGCFAWPLYKVVGGWMWCGADDVEPDGVLHADLKTAAENFY